ncbi:MAG: hypothetical protein HOP07_03850 [Bacteriovoracaceae bacterium]|nr:hypothetical protein [Bacteriovoracaceae bacterium]
MAGFDCLDDFDWHGEDPLFFRLTNAPSAVTLGRFLRRFAPRNIEKIQALLPELGLKIRKILEPNVYKIIFAMDSSDHQQYGVKSEGVDFGYKKLRCLNSQNIFDDKGICYGFKLRKGNTGKFQDSCRLTF